ncbi:hypothetical protein V8E36_009033, partial [Tilletia maclaganii]
MSEAGERIWREGKEEKDKQTSNIERCGSTVDVLECRFKGRKRVLESGRREVEAERRAVEALEWREGLYEPRKEIASTGFNFPLHSSCWISTFPQSPQSSSFSSPRSHRCHLLARRSIQTNFSPVFAKGPLPWRHLPSHLTPLPASIPMVLFNRPVQSQLVLMSHAAMWRNPLWDFPQQHSPAHKFVFDWTIAGLTAEGRPRELTEEEFRGLFFWPDGRLPSLRPQDEIDRDP